MKKAILTIIVVAIIFSFWGCGHGDELSLFLKRLEGNAESLALEELYPVIQNPEGTGANQGFAIVNDTVFQLYNDNKVVLLDFYTGNEISRFDITSLHGDTIDFSDEYMNDDDEFPLAYITADTNPAKVFVVHITRERANLVATYEFDLEKTGYYAGHCLDATNKVIYMVGYHKNDYIYGNDNEMIVSLWNLAVSNTNENGTITPMQIDSFSVPFIITIQGQRFYNGKLYLLSSHNGYGGVEIDTKIYVIDVASKEEVAVYDKLPDIIKCRECEGFDLIEYDGAIKMIISTCSGNSDGMYYILQ